ncbi:hypothetical protein HK102_012148 [Quaeritorhiza haematococci]|nr:hypothetical protein HK102_012148 [Quaeritorhiza haematococci]
MTADFATFFDLDGYLQGTPLTSGSPPIMGSPASTSSLSPPTSTIDAGEDLSGFFDEIATLPMYDGKDVGVDSAEALFQDILAQDVQTALEGVTSAHGKAPPTALFESGLVTPNASPLTDIFDSPAAASPESQCLSSPGSENGHTALLQSPEQSMYAMFPELILPSPVVTPLTPPTLAEVSKSVTIPWGTSPAITPVVAILPTVMSALNAFNQQQSQQQASAVAPVSHPTPPTISQPSQVVATPSAHPDQPQQPVKRKVGRKPKPRPTDPEIIRREAQLKRQKNTESARRSRQRKMMKMESLEVQMKTLSSDYDELEKSYSALEDRERQHVCKIRILEDRVTKYRKMLTKAGIVVDDSDDELFE